jgi:hypothetical protein
MQLAGAHAAIVTREKIVEYLLNVEHADGAPKARFFGALGFTVEEWQTFATALREIAVQYPIKSTIESAHGRKYIIEGEIITPRVVPPL